MRRTKILCGLLGLLPGLAFADVVLELPKDVQLLVVNGNDAGYSSFGFDYKENVTMPNGINQVVFRVSKVVNESGNKMTKFKSKPLVATFDSADSILELNVPNLKSLSQGYSFNDNPKFDVVSKQGDLKFVETNQIYTLSNFGTDFVQATENFNKSNESASLANHGSLAQSEYKEVKVHNVTVAEVDEVGNIDKTAQEFSKLTKEQKQKFMSWAINNM